MIQPLKMEFIQNKYGKRYLFSKPLDRPSILLKLHHSIGHSGFMKILKELCCEYYWELMSFGVTDIINKCIVCQSQQFILKSTSYTMVKTHFV